MSISRPSPQDSKLLVLSAPSGTGKSTLAQMVIGKYPKFSLSISHTTRAGRGDEKEGEDYYFVDIPTFEEMIRNDEFLEHAKVFQKHFYGTSKKHVLNCLDQGQHVLFDIDVQGARAIKDKFKDRCITVFILPPSLDELRRRLLGRGTESEQAVERRLTAAQTELSEAHWFDYRITNDDLRRTFQELESILRKEKFGGI